MPYEVQVPYEKEVRVEVPVERVSRPTSEREFFIDNLLVRIHSITEMIWWTGLVLWKFEFPFPGSLTSTFQAHVGRSERDVSRFAHPKHAPFQDIHTQTRNDSRTVYTNTHRFRVFTYQHATYYRLNLHWVRFSGFGFRVWGLGRELKGFREWLARYM